MTNGRVHVYRESREDRNKRIAIEAIDLLERAVAGNDELAHEVELFHQRWESRGVNWTRPGLMHLDLDDWVSAAEMAEFADVAPNTIHQWRSRGHITSIPGPNGPLFNVGEVVAYQARRRTRRMRQSA